MKEYNHLKQLEMQKIITILTLIVFLSSCSTETDPLQDFDHTGTWKLIKMTGQYTNSELTGDDMGFQESYLLKGNGSFIKTRLRDDNFTEVEGVYELTTEGFPIHGESVITYIEMIHDSQNGIIGSCTSSSEKEYLYITTENELKSTWEACDGPGLYYQKTK